MKNFMQQDQIDSNKVYKISQQPRGDGKYVASLPNRKPIEEMNDDEIIFWMLFERDAMIALRNFLGDCPEKNKEALELDINETESRYEDYLAAIKDRMRKGGKPNAR